MWHSHYSAKFSHETKVYTERHSSAPLAGGQRAIVMTLCPSCVRPFVRLYEANIVRLG